MIRSAQYPQRVILMLLLGLCFAVAANEGMTITVHAGAQHTFQGFGASCTGGHNAEVIRKLYSPDEADFRVIRLWSALGGKVNSLNSIYGAYVREIKKVQPDLIVLLAPCGTREVHTGDVNGYASYYCQGIKAARDQGLKVDVTGVMNEGESHNRLYVNQSAPIVKAFRSQLDSRGLQDVEVIAVEAASVDSTLYAFTQAIKDDPAAMEATYAWAYHSYNCAMTYAFRDMVQETGKPIWETESSVDQWSTQEPGANSGQIAGNAGTRILADLNMGATEWCYFFGAGGGDDGTALLYTDGRPKLQYIYMLQISKTINVGARFRYCLSDKRLPRVEMTWEYGQKPAIVCAAAVNPDGSMGIGLCNGTGIERNSGIATFYPPTAYDVTLHVEELEEAGEVGFRVLRSNKSVKMSDEGILTMVDGQMSVTLQSIDLVSLRSEEAIEARMRAPRASQAPQPVQFERRGGVLRIKLGGPARYSARILTTQGKVAKQHAGDSDSPAVSLSGLSAGAYVVELITPLHRIRHRFVTGG